MIKVGKLTINEVDGAGVRRLIFPLSASRGVWLSGDRLIFELPLQFEKLKNIGEAVAFSLLPIAYVHKTHIQLPKDLYIEPGTQERIYEICSLWNKWFYMRRQVKIHADINDAIFPCSDNRYGVQLFSGGIDSLATFMRHREDIKSLVFFRGADIPVTRVERFREVKKNILHFAKRYSKEFIALTTNVHDLSDVSWLRVAQSCAIISPLLMLASYIDKIYIASSFFGKAGMKLPWGSHPNLDPLIRCESVEIIHDGFELKRTEKTLLVSSEPQLLRVTRVCNGNIVGQMNCGKCEKCYRTRLIFILLGLEEDIKSFPDRSISLHTISEFLKKETFPAYEKIFWCDNLEFLESSPLPAQGKAQLIATLKDKLGPFYEDYKKGFPQGLPAELEYISKLRKVEKKLRLKPDSLTWIKKFIRSLRGLPHRNFIREHARFHRV
ncbi:MAG: hypothetical protein JSW40_09590 [Candidatus Omnitrophota bacterium]|nr:MAG: hypothetical protein JSW40_09590 [Candidatus Omnitrophota bacterium]